MISASLPSDEERPKSVMPAVGALHHPATRLATYTTHHRPLAAAPDVWADPAPANARFDGGIVVALVQAAMYRSPQSATALMGIVNRGQCHPHIGHVGSAEHDADRDALGIGEDVAFRAALAPVCRVSAGERPPLGALTMTLSSAVQFQSIPIRWS